MQDEKSLKEIIQSRMLVEPLVRPHGEKASCCGSDGI